MHGVCVPIKLYEVISEKEQWARFDHGVDDC